MERPLEAATLVLQPTGGKASPSWRVVRRRDGAVVGQIILTLKKDKGLLSLSFAPAFHSVRAEAVRRLLRLCFTTLELENVALTVSDEALCSEIKFPLRRANWQALRVQRPKILVVAAALIDGDGRVLLARRPEGKSMAGLWEFPGGKVDAQETPEEALVRELQEELGLDVGVSCLAPLAFASHDYDSFHLLMPLFACRVWRGTPQSREGQELAWVAPARLSDYPMPPADVPLVAQLREWV